MKQMIQSLKLEKLKEKKTYLFLLFLLIGGILAGAFFITILSNEDKQLVSSQLLNYFTQVKEGNLNYYGAFANSLMSNLGVILLIWFLGVSIIGLPIIIFLLFLSSFVLGFSVGAIIFQFGIKGILGAILYVFPHQVILLCAILITSYYAVVLSLALLKAILKKKSIDFKSYIGRYYFILLLGLLTAFFISAFEVFIVPNLIKLFGFLF